MTNLSPKLPSASLAVKYENVLSRFQVVSRHGDGAQAKCPCHIDRQASLSISLKGDKILLFCFAGCNVNDIVKQVGLTWADFFPDGNTPESVYQYRKADGRLNHEKVKFRHSDGSKHFVPRHIDADGHLVDSLDGVERIPYRYPSVIRAIANDEPILYCEGEKDADNASLLGFTTTTMGGASDWKPEFVHFFKGARLILAPDKDQKNDKGVSPGLSLSVKMHDSLLPVVKSLRCIIYPSGKDTTDYITDGHGRADFDKLITETPELAHIEIPDADADTRQYHLTDLGLAERFASQHGHNVRFNVDVKESDGWFVWTGKYWKQDFGGVRVRQLARDTVRNLYFEASRAQDRTDRDNLANFAKKSESDSSINNMLSLAQSENGIAINSAAFDSNIWLLNCDNGTVDLRTGELHSHSQSDLLSTIIRTEYRPDAKCPTWERFLRDVTGGKQDLIDYLQRCVGYSLTGSIAIHVLFFLYGLGNNGKSTFVRAIRQLLGDYSCKVPTELFLTKDKQSHGGGQANEDLVSTRGKRFVIASEIEDGKRLNMAFVKDITGGEPITGRHIYERKGEWTPTHKIWLSGNHKPEITDTTLSAWRRVKLIPFTVTIAPDRVDDHLGDKLEQEYPGILAWAVKGCLEYQANGLQECRTVIDATQEYRMDSDVLAGFIDDKCQINATSIILKTQLRVAYESWCVEVGATPLNQKQFKARLLEKGITEGPRASGGGRTWAGISLVTLVTDSKESCHAQPTHGVTSVTENSHNSPYEENQLNLVENPVTLVTTGTNGESLVTENDDFAVDNPQCPLCSGDSTFRSGHYICVACGQPFDSAGNLLPKGV